MKPLLLPLLLAVTTFASSAAEWTPRAAPVAVADTGRVIVKFKSDASTVRARALSASAAGETAAQVLGARAGTLGSRLGLALKAGHAVGERAQVVTAEGMTSAQLAARLAADSEVEYAEPDRRMTRLATPNDTYFLSGPTAGPAVGQWYLRAPDSLAPAAINAAGAWDLSQGGTAGQGVIVAVLDTGIRSEHPDLANKLVAGYDMVTDTGISNDGDGRDSDPSDPGDWVSASEAGTGKFTSCPEANSSWHGTQVAGIIGAETNNGAGVAGTGWNVRIQPVRVLGKCYGLESDIAAGIQWAAGVSVAGLPTNPTPAKVINLSLGGTGSCSRTYQDAINAAVARGVTVVVAAGNTAGHAVGAPGNCSNVITVAAVRHVGTKVGYSDVGTQVTLAAPGGNCVQPDGSGLCDYPIMTTLNAGTTSPGASIYSNGTTDPSVGTSFSAPQVSGVAALMLALQPSLTPSTVKTYLQRGVRPFPTTGGSTGIAQCRAPNGVDQLECYCTTSTCGAGLLDASASVALVQQGAVATLALSSTSTSPTVGTAVTLTANTSASSDRLPLTVSWAISQGGGLASLSATSGTSVVLTPTAAGTVVVQATVTDTLGFQTSSSQTFTVAAAASGGSTGGSTGGSDGGSSSSGGGGGGGGGAMSLTWLALLAAATVALRRVRTAA